MKNLHITVILSATLLCNAQREKIFTTIFSSHVSKNRIYFGTSDNLTEAKTLKEFERDVTSQAVYKNYLFVSIKSSYWWSDDGAIWRANITDSKNFSVDPESWEKFQVMNNYGDDITCMTVAEGYVYAGMTDDSIMRCSAEQKNSCEIFKEFGTVGLFFMITGMRSFIPITGLDYNPADGRIYVLSNNILRSCSVDKNERCKTSDVYSKASRVSAFKVAFDAIWIGKDINKIGYCDNVYQCTVDRKFVLLKCPINKDFDLHCQIFGEYLVYNLLINSFSSTNQYLYFNFGEAKEIQRCDPNNSTSCFYSIPIPRDMNKFIIVP